MNDYEQTLSIHASPEAIFEFVADVANLPRYLPTTHSAAPQGPGRVVVDGEAKGHAYHADGFMRADRDALRLEWGSDEGHYSGWMQLVDDSGHTSVTVHLTMREKPGSGAQRPSDADIDEGITAGLESIRNHVEAQRPSQKQEPRAAQPR